MHKKIIVITFIAIIIMTGCKSNKANKKIYQRDTATNISMYIKEGTLTSTSATVIIKDNSGKKNSYSKAVQIFKKVNNEWIQLEFIKDNISITTESYLVDDNNLLELELKWEGAYGKLSTGEYKLVMYADDINNNKSYSFSTKFYIK